MKLNKKKVKSLRMSAAKKALITLNGSIVTRLDIVEKVLAAEDIYLASAGTQADKAKLADAIIELIENAESVSDILDVVAAVDATKDFIGYLEDLGI